MSAPMMTHAPVDAAAAAAIGAAGAAPHLSDQVRAIRPGQRSAHRMPPAGGDVNRFISMQAQRGANVSVSNMLAGAQTSTLSADNMPIVQTLHPRSWPRTCEYDKNLHNGDFLFAVNAGDRPPSKLQHSPARWQNPRSVVSIPQLQRESVTGARRAARGIVAMMRQRDHGFRTAELRYPDIDPDQMLRIARANSNNFVPSDMARDPEVARKTTEFLLEQDAAKWERKLSAAINDFDMEDGEEEGEGPADTRRLAEEIVRDIAVKIWNAYDTHKTIAPTVADYHDLLTKNMVHLFPRLLHRMYTPLGTIEDVTQAAPFHRQVYNRKAGITICVRGRSKARNIFGEPVQPRREARPGPWCAARDDGNLVRPPSYYMPRTIGLFDQLHLVLATPKKFFSYIAVQNFAQIQCRPVVALPTCVLSKEELYARINDHDRLGLELACLPKRSVYRKTSSGVVTPSGDPVGWAVRPCTGLRTWYLGRIVEIDQSPRRGAAFYDRALGISNHMGPQDIVGAYAAAKEQRFIKLNLFTR